MQAGEFDVWDRPKRPPRTQGPIEHPGWNFQKTIRSGAGKTASENNHPLREHLMDMNVPPIPGITTDIKARELPSRGCSVASLYNDHRPHSGLGWLTPADFADERLIGPMAGLSHNPGKFQLLLAQNRVALQKTAGANSKLDKTWGQGQNKSLTVPGLLRCLQPIPSWPYFD